MIATLFVPFLILILLSCPIGISQALASLLMINEFGVISVEGFTKSMTLGLNSFTLVAVPLFTFAGDIMGKGGISKRLLNVANIFFGSMTGGLGVVTIVACMFFAAISGAGSAVVAAIGLIMIPLMVQEGYDKDYSTAMVATSGGIGVIIPPSIPLVVYAVSANASVTALFTAGFPVGILTGIALIIYTLVTSRKRGYVPQHQKRSLRENLHIFWDALPSLLLPVLVLGSIYAGICTPTEAAAFSCVLGILLSVFVYKEISWKELPYMAFRALVLSVPVSFIIGCSTGFGRILAISQIPTMIANAILSLTTSKYFVLLLINILLLIVGCFMETNSSIIILVPIMLPIVTALGVSPVQFGLVMVLNLSIGFITPPFGANLFMASEVSGVPYTRLARVIWPWIGIEIIVLLLITYIPAVSLFLPRLLGMSV